MPPKKAPEKKPKKPQNLSIIQEYRAQKNWDEGETLLEVARRHTRAKLENRFKHEKEVEADIAKRVAKILLKERLQILDLSPKPPRKSDLSFWVTRVGEKPPIRTPEEEKGSRKVSMTQYTYELNGYRAHAKKGFVYWPKLEDMNCLSKPLQPIHRAPEGDLPPEQCKPYNIPEQPSSVFFMITTKGFVYWPKLKDMNCLSKPLQPIHRAPEGDLPPEQCKPYNMPEQPSSVFS